MGAVLRTVSVPAAMGDLFAAAEQVVSRYFRNRKDDPEHGTIEISGERYILVRAASLSVEFFGLVHELYGSGRAAEADEFARNILFDLAHAIGRKDAKSFHAKMGLVDPIARLSAGPVHFSHAGWAFVNILPESKPSPDEEFFLVYEHPYSFESDAWLRAKQARDFPVCVMNAGYSSGWCQESFGVELVSAEVRCRVRGDETCRFVMAPPSRIEAHVLREVPTGLSFIPDFFARKRAEEQLRIAHADLERRVEERTADLKREMEDRRRIERELHQQRRLEALGRLAGGVAHDFNNLMAIVMANGALLERELGPHDPGRGYLSEMILAVRRASDLTRQLMAFGRAAPSEHQEIDLDSVVESLAKMLARLLGDDVDLTLALSAAGAQVLASRSEIEQVVVNLVVNARDALPKGGRIAISTMLKPASGAASEMVLLRVSDTGIGMSAEVVSSIFDPFFSTKAGAGAGLGLSTVYGIVQRASGSIAVESEPGAGSTFIVSLPRAEGHVKEALVETAPRPAETRRLGSGETVLFVEDQALLRAALGNMLTALGYRWLAAASPSEAVALLAGGAAPALLLVDLMLPEMSGVELVSRVEAMLPGIPVLFMSGNASDALDDRRAKGESVVFLPKPFSLDALSKVLAELLAGPRG